MRRPFHLPAWLTPLFLRPLLLSSRLVLQLKKVYSKKATRQPRDKSQFFLVHSETPGFFFLALLLFLELSLPFCRLRALSLVSSVFGFHLGLRDLVLFGVSEPLVTGAVRLRCGRR